MRANRKTWYAVVLGLLGVALIADRLFLGTTSQPQEAEAETELYGHPVDAQGQPIRMLKVEVAPFPGNLPRGADVSRDPFAMTSTVQKRLLATPDETVKQAEDPSSPITAEHFVSNHQLSAVVRVDGEWRAVINDVLTAPGQRIDGCVIIGIDERSVQAKCGRQLVRLTIQEPLERK